MTKFLIPNRFQKRRNEIREYINRLKEASPCKDCGNSFPACVMDYDHLKAKRQNVGRLVNSGSALKTILDEISKCDLVCANCHRIRTHSRYKNNRSDRFAGSL